MGLINSKAKARKRTLKRLKETSHFDERELALWYKGFMEECPSGKLSKNQFNTMCEHFFPYGYASNSFFSLFDKNHDGVIEFDEFINALSVTTKGSLEEKLCWTFQLYDQDQDGYVTKCDMPKIVDAVYQMVDHVSDFPLDENTPEKRVDKIFSLMDKDENDILSLEEFVAGCKADGQILRALSSFDDPY